MILSCRSFGSAYAAAPWKWWNRSKANSLGNSSPALTLSAPILMTSLASLPVLWSQRRSVCRRREDLLPRRQPDGGDVARVAPPQRMLHVCQRGVGQHRLAEHNLGALLELGDDQREAVELAHQRDQLRRGREAQRRLVPGGSAHRSRAGRGPGGASKFSPLEACARRSATAAVSRST